jgi:hypothetical protein
VAVTDEYGILLNDDWQKELKLPGRIHLQYNLAHHNSHTACSGLDLATI